MIRSFRSRGAEDIYHGVSSKAARAIPSELHGKVRRLFDQLNACTRLQTMRVPPGNRFESLKGEFRGFYSLRVNQQWRVIFGWREGNAYDVDVVDYHK